VENCREYQEVTLPNSNPEEAPGNPTV
jgi:hypothetical protein